MIKVVSFFFLFLFLIVEIQAQISIQLRYENIQDSILFQKINPNFPKTAADSSAAIVILKGGLKQLQAQTFLESSFDSIHIFSKKLNTSLHIGKSYKWAKLRNGNINTEYLSQVGYRERLFDGKPFSPKEVLEAGAGVIIYLRQEGRGIGLENKLKAYNLQDQGYDTFEANTVLGLEPDMRTYGLGAQMLYHLGVRKIRLITNNPSKVTGIQGYGLDIVERVSLETRPTESNLEYLKTKKVRFGHFLNDDNLG